MFKLTRWCAVSLLLHLAAATALFFLLPSDDPRPPQAVMVSLDRLSLPDQPGQRMTKAPAATRATLPSPSPAAVKRPTVAVQPDRKPPRQASDPPAQVRTGTARPEPAASASSAPDRAPDREPFTGAAPTPAQEASPAPGVRPAAPVASPAVAAAAPGTDPARPVLARTQAPDPAQERYLKEHFGYIAELIARRLVYPPVARRVKWSGRVLLSFSIRQDGSVHGIRVLQSSGFALLDRSALETVRSVAQFPKPPAPAEIVVPINFTLTP